jgi:hypothetical protein
MMQSSLHPRKQRWENLPDKADLSRSPARRYRPIRIADPDFEWAKFESLPLKPSNANLKKASVAADPVDADITRTDLNLYASPGGDGGGFGEMGFESGRLNSNTRIAKKP